MALTNPPLRLWKSVGLYMLVTLQQLCLVVQAGSLYLSMDSA